MKIYEEITPNPHATKYILDKIVLASGKVTFDREAASAVPLAKALFRMGAIHTGNVTQVHFFENVITITQDGMGNLGQIVSDTINAHINDHDPHFNEQSEQERDNKRAELSPDVQKIESILDDKIRPALQMDGGDLDVLQYDKDTHRLLVAYQGACGGCPSASGGTLMAIQGILQDEFDSEIMVIPDQSPTDYL